MLLRSVPACFFLIFGSFFMVCVVDPNELLTIVLEGCEVKLAQPSPTLCDPLDRSPPGFPVHHHLPELIQTHVHRVGDAIRPSHPLSSPSPPALNLKTVNTAFIFVVTKPSHEVAAFLHKLFPCFLGSRNVSLHRTTLHLPMLFHYTQGLSLLSHPPPPRVGD